MAATANEVEMPLAKAQREGSVVAYVKTTSYGWLLVVELRQTYIQDCPQSNSLTLYTLACGLPV